MSKTTTTRPAAKVVQEPLKPFWDALQANDFAGAFAVASKREKEVPTNTLIISYALYACKMLDDWKGVELRLKKLQNLAPSDLESFNILRHSLKRTPYFKLCTELIENALEIDPKRTDLLKMVILDHFRNGDYKKAQISSSLLYNQSKESQCLIWSASIVGMLFRQVFEKLNVPAILPPKDEKNDEKNRKDKSLDQYHSTLTIQIKSSNDTLSIFKLVSTLISRAFSNVTQPNMQQMIKIMSVIGNDPNRNPNHLNPTWFQQFFQLYIDHGLGSVLISQFKTNIEPKVSKIVQSFQPHLLNFNPFYGIFDQKNEKISQNEEAENVENVKNTADLPLTPSQFLSILPTFSKTESLSIIPMDTALRVLQLLDSPLALDFKSKQKQQWNQLRLQALLSTITVRDHTIIPSSSPLPIDSNKDSTSNQSLDYVGDIALFKSKILEIKNLCLEILKFWPDQWNVLSIYTYILVLDECNGWYIFKYLAMLQSSDSAILNGLFSIELNFLPNPMALQPLTPMHSWVDIFIKNFVYDFNHLSNDEVHPKQPYIETYNCIDIIKALLSDHSSHVQPLTQKNMENIKNHLSGLWIDANTPQDSSKLSQLPSNSTDPSNLKGKFPTRGPLLACIEVDRLSFLFNFILSFSNSFLKSNSLSFNSTLSAYNYDTFISLSQDYIKANIDICEMFIIDINLYSFVYLDKPYFWSDLQPFLNIFSTLQNLPKIYSNHKDIAQIIQKMFEPLENTNVLNDFHEKNFDYQKNIHAFLVEKKQKTKNSHHDFALNAISTLPTTSTWSNLITTYTNALVYSQNIHLVSKDEEDDMNKDKDSEEKISTPKEEKEEENEKTLKNTFLQPQFVTSTYLLLPLYSNEQVDSKSTTKRVWGYQSNRKEGDNKAQNDQNPEEYNQTTTQNNNQNQVVMLHERAIVPYCNAITLAFALDHSDDLYKSKSDQVLEMILKRDGKNDENDENDNSGNNSGNNSGDKNDKNDATIEENTDENIKRCLPFSKIYQQYALSIQLLHAAHQSSQKTIKQAEELKKSIEKFQSKMNHLELTPPTSQVEHDETPAQLLILSIYMMIDLFNTVDLVKRFEKESEQSTGIGFLERPKEVEKVEKAEEKVEQYKKDILKLFNTFLPSPSQLQSGIYSTLQYLQNHYPYEIQSQLLHSKLYSYGNSSNLIENFKVFGQMSIKQIQWDTLSYLSPTQNNLNFFDPKISTIISKQVVSFHKDFYDSDGSSYEGAFKQDNSYHTINMNALSQRLLFSTSFFQSFFTLCINEACFINPVKANYMFILDKQYDDDYEPTDPVGDLEKLQEKKEREIAAQAQIAASKSTASSSKSPTGQAPKTAAEKKAAIAAAQAKAKNAKNSKKDEEKIAVSTKPPEKKIYKIEPKVNHKLPIHLQNLQLITGKHYESLSAISIHSSLLNHFMDLLSSIKTTPKGRFLPTFLPHFDSEHYKISISLPNTLSQLFLFISNRQNNNDITPLQTPSLFPTIISSLPIAQEDQDQQNYFENRKNYFENDKKSFLNHYSLSTSLHSSQTSSIRQNIPLTYSLIHPLAHTHFNAYLPSVNDGITISQKPTIVQRDTLTSRTLLNEYHYASDETSMVLRIKALYSIILMILSTPQFYPKQVQNDENNENNFNGIIIDSEINDTTLTEKISLEKTLEKMKKIQKNSENDKQLDENPLIPHNLLLFSTDFQKLSHLALLNNGISIDTWLDTYHHCILEYYRLADGTQTDQNPRIECSTNTEFQISSMVLASFRLLAETTSAKTKDDAILHLPKIHEKINQLFKESTNFLNLIAQQDDRNDLDENNDKNSKTKFSTILSLYITYLSPILLLLTQKYGITTSFNKDSSTNSSTTSPSNNDIGFINAMNIAMGYHSKRQIRLADALISAQSSLKDEKEFENKENNEQLLTTSSSLLSPYLINPSSLSPLSLPSSKQSSIYNSSHLIPHLPTEISKQSETLLKKKIWTEQYLFETFMSTLQSYHAGMYVPPHLISKSQLPIGAIDSSLKQNQQQPQAQTQNQGKQQSQQNNNANNKKGGATSNQKQPQTNTKSLTTQVTTIATTGSASTVLPNHVGTQLVELANKAKIQPFHLLTFYPSPSDSTTSSQSQQLQQSVFDLNFFDIQEERLKEEKMKKIEKKLNENNNSYLLLTQLLDNSTQ